jgi:hypothetical protein
MSGNTERIFILPYPYAQAQMVKFQSKLEGAPTAHSARSTTSRVRREQRLRPAIVDRLTQFAPCYRQLS